MLSLCFGERKDSDSSSSYEKEDPFEQCARLISGFVPSWVPRPISSTAPYRVALVGLSGMQVLLAFHSILAGDLYGGTYAGLLGVLGFNTSKAERSSEMFKTYLVITFINGCVQGMEVFQLVLMGAPFLEHSTSYIAPVVSSLASYIGWMYVKKQKKMLTDPEYAPQIREEHMRSIEAAWVAQQTGKIPGSNRLPIIEEEEDTVAEAATGGSCSPVVTKGG